MKKRVVIAGGTGFIGEALAHAFVKKGYHVVSLTYHHIPSQTSNDGITLVGWDGRASEKLVPYVDGADVVVNLAGERITERWSQEKKESILKTRLEAGSAIAKAIKDTHKKPGVVIQASSISAYGDTGEREADEETSFGETYLAYLCAHWESSTESVERLKVRRCIIRSATVLGTKRFLPERVRPYRVFLGGPLGSGEQWDSFIHITDEVNAIIFLVENKKAHGIFNLCLPQSIREREFARVLGQTLGRPSFFKTPAWWLKLRYGERAKEMMLLSHRVEPKRLRALGFKYTYKNVNEALAAIYPKDKIKK